MKPFKNFIKESWIPPKEIAKEIRKFLKNNFKLSSKDISVKVSGVNSVNLMIKSVNAYKYLVELENLAKKNENLYYDEITGEILAGGNLYVFVYNDSKFTQYLKEKVANYLYKVLEKDLKSGKEEINKEIVPGIYFYCSNGECSVIGRRETYRVKDLLNKKKLENVASELLFLIEKYHREGKDKAWNFLFKKIL